jgi:hypothetical protein
LDGCPSRALQSSRAISPLIPPASTPVWHSFVCQVSPCAPARWNSRFLLHSKPNPTRVISHRRRFSLSLSRLRIRTHPISPMRRRMFPLESSLRSQWPPFR